MHYGFTTPKMTDKTSKGPPKGRRDRVPSNPQHAINPSIQDTWSDLMFTFQNCMDHFGSAHQPPSPQEASPINPPITQQEAKPQ